MTESTAKFSNFTKDNRKGENVEGTLQAPAVLFSINEKPFKPDVQPAYHEIYDRHPSYQKRSLTHSNIEESISYLRSFQSEVPAENQGEPVRIKFTINDKFDGFKSEIFNELSRIHQSKSIVLLFIGKDGNEFLVFWKMAGMDYFLGLRKFEFIPDLNYTDLYEFVADFLLNSLRFDHIGFHQDHSIKNNEIDIKNLADHQNCNIFQNAAELGEINVVKVILQHSKMDLARDLLNSPLSAQALAIRNGYLDVFGAIIKADYTYPLFLDQINFPDDIKEFIQNGTEMHLAIQTRNKKKVKEILTKMPRQKHYYNLDNRSALYVALWLKFFDIYEILLSNGVQLGQHEEVFEFLQCLSPREKRKLTKIHFKCTKDLQDNHLNILMMNTTVSHDDNNHDDKEHHIKKAYSVLNQIPSTKVILEAVAASKNFEIIFDFKRDSVHMVDLTVDSDTKGIFYSSGKIVIGAKQLVDPETENETFGTLAHELCHYAMALTYDNTAKPYDKNNFKKSKEFERISQECRKSQKKEQLIEMVYNNYDEQHFHAELIVRAPHLMAMYHNQPEKLKEAEKDFPALFGYYEKTVVPDMTKALPRIKKKAEKMSWWLVTLICSVISLLLMGVMGYILFCVLHVPSYKYSELSLKNQALVRDARVSYKGITVNLWTLYPNGTKVFENLTSEHITQTFDNKILDLENSHFNYLTEKIYFTWTTITDPIKHKFLNSQVYFQNSKIKLQELHKLYPKAFNSLTFEQIELVLDGKELLLVGNMKELSTKFYMDRKFIPEHSMYAHMKYDNLRKNNTINSTFLVHYESYPKPNLSREFLKYQKSSASVVGNSVDRINENQALQKLANYSKFHKNLNDMINKTEKSRMFVLSSEAGAGKTVTFEHLVMELKRMFPTRWVSYVDLKDHRNLYDEKELLGGVEEFLKKILRLGFNNEFEKQIFEDSYRSGMVMLLWNGFDEISPLYSNFTIKLLKSIHKSTNNTQYICTRPLYSHELSEQLATDPHLLVPFNKTEQKEFFRKYLNLKNFTDSEQVNATIENFFNITHRLVQNLSRKYDTPLLLSMFADLPANQTKTLNLYDVFNNFVKFKNKILEDKNITDSNSVFKNPTDSTFNPYQMYQWFALNTDIFPFAFSTNPLILRLAIFKSEFETSQFSDLSQAGILFINEETKFDFAHKTFAEFFIAQYLIDNLYKAKTFGLSDEEIDSRLELFFQMIQYSLSFDNVINFVMDYVKANEGKVKFGSKISEILKKKYKKHLIYVLNKPYKRSFRFFFEFFKKDKELMLDMLKVHEPETFFTALSNPFYMANNLDPEDIKNAVKPYLTPNEFRSFIYGKNQRGVFLYGMFDRREFDKLTALDFPSSNETQFWDFYDSIKSNLTQEELKQMFLNPIVTFIYRKHSTSNSTNLKFWLEVSSLFKEHEMLNFIGNLFPQLFRPKLEISSEIETQSLNMFIDKTEQLLSNDEILKMANQTHLLFKSARSFPELQIVWDFVVKHTSQSNRKELLKYDFRVSQVTEDQQFYSMYYKFFVMTPRVLHVNIFADNFTGSIDFVEKIYNETFEKSEILGFFSESNNFLFPLIFTRPIEACQNIASYLERLYGHEKKKMLVEMIERNFNDTKFTIFEYFDKMLAFAFADRENFRKKLKIFSDLRDKLKNLK